jgi:hypothetical protein
MDFAASKPGGKAVPRLIRGFVVIFPSQIRFGDVYIILLPQAPQTSIFFQVLHGQVRILLTNIPMFG